jgi:ribosomal protein S18 acetylase RimI-like enzyme
VRLPDGSVRIEPLAASHDRATFACGNDALDRYIREQAMQDMRRGVARAFVAIAAGRPTQIAGFFTLSAAAVSASDLPAETAKRLPRHPIPAALVGRLAVDSRFARRGLGSILLADAVRKAIAATELIAITVLVVDPIDDTARRFYEAFGFRSLNGPQQRVFLALSTRKS